MYEYGELTWELHLQTRVEYFYSYLKVKPGSLSGALVLDAGCGNGTLTAGVGASGPEIIGMDYSEKCGKSRDGKSPVCGRGGNESPLCAREMCNIPLLHPRPLMWSILTASFITPRRLRYPFALWLRW